MNDWKVFYYNVRMMGGGGGGGDFSRYSHICSQTLARASHSVNGMVS